MKKSTLLSLATVGTIVATSIGTFAAWDQLEVTSATAEVTISNGVTMSLDAMTFTPTERTTLSATDASGFAQTTTTTVTVKDVPSTAKDSYEMKYTPTVTTADGTPADVEVTIADDKNKALAGTATDEHTLTVTVTPKVDTAQGKTYNVSVKAEIVSKTAQ